MVNHSQVEKLISDLRSSNSEENARIVENLYGELKHTVSKMQALQAASDFYSRVAGLKTVWGE